MSDADDDGDRGELERRREDARDVVERRARTVRTRVPEIALQHLRRRRCRTAARAAGRGRARSSRARRPRRGARSPTTASTGSIGTTRPITKVTSSRPRKVTASVPRRSEPGPRSRTDGERRCRIARADWRRQLLGALPVLVVVEARAPDHALARLLARGDDSICWKMMTKGEIFWCSRWISS